LRTRSGIACFSTLKPHAPPGAHKAVKKQSGEKEDAQGKHLA